MPVPLPVTVLLSTLDVLVVLSLDDASPLLLNVSWLLPMFIDNEGGATHGKTVGEETEKSESSCCHSNFT
jgi:hypothetical protein